MIRRSARPSSNYLVVSNSVVRDRRISFAAGGLLLHLLSKPDHWEVSPSALAKEAQEGRDKIYKLLGELIGAGYCKRITRRGERGKIVGTDYEISDAPRDADPLPENPDTDLPDTDLPDTDLPDTDLPDTDLPDTDLPDTDLPDTDLPDTDLPDTDLPDTDLPDTDLPDTDLPDTDLPDTDLPDTDLPYPGLPTQESKDTKKVTNLENNQRESEQGGDLAVPQEPTPPSKRGSRLPDDWQLTQEFYDEAAKVRPEVIHQIYDIAASFGDYWKSQSGRQGVRCDWMAVWRNWVRRERFVPPKRPAPQRRTRNLSAVEIATDTNW
ncbi:hypothetical protein [Microbulbifer variabilis]|uniref:hypothetical protein n=1 Tax=Microbulbifer variabilis TaxID=266805 RepID=UPI00035E1DC4|nr:hypothetical protein [Microbulbifer variabilis]